MKKSKVKTTSIGGQAVLEGVMMRGKTCMATCVRDEDGIIRTETKRLVPAEKKNRFLRLPIIRGVVSFIDSLVSGSKTLMRSASVYGEAEPSKVEKWFSKIFKIDIFSVVEFFSLLIGLAIAVGLFIFAPMYSRIGIENIIGNNFEFSPWARNFIEGGIKILIFIIYILLCMLLKDIRRTFMYHGAEHKTITCYEQGLDLTVENVKKCSRVHDRCGTTFIFFVLFISIILFAVFEALLGGVLLNAIGNNSWLRIVRILCKLAILPLVAGISYELLKGLAKTKSKIFYPIKAPGLLLQRLTTKEPDDSMIEVAIKAFNTVYEMDADQSIPEKEFEIAKKRSEVIQSVKNTLKENGIDEEAEAEWIVSIALSIKRDEVYSDKFVSPKNIEKINNIVKERITGRPLWYCIGDTDFYGYTIKVDESVLIPRPETEILVSESLKVIKEDSSVLDLCTGSGAIAIAVSCEKGIKVTATDISQSALKKAEENATLNKANLELIESDLFENLKDRKFDVIISNPPYVKSQDILNLQKEVKDFEPHLALDGGEDGLEFYKKIAKLVPKYLNEGGILLLECGIDQANDIVNLLKGYKSVEILKDYEKIDRVIKAVF